MTGAISKETDAVLHTLLYPRDVFEKMADASWGINKTTGEKEPEDLVFTRQMAALYNKDAYDGKNAYLRYILPIWIIRIRFDLTRPEARFLQMEAFLQLLTSIHLFLYGQLFLVEKLVAQRHWGNRCIRYPVISP